MEGSGLRIREAVLTAGQGGCFFRNHPLVVRRRLKKWPAITRKDFFRNNGVIHYECIVHNRVVGHTSTKSSKIEIMHYGYDVDEKKANEKHLRTTELLKQQIRENTETIPCRTTTSAPPIWPRAASENASTNRNRPSPLPKKNRMTIRCICGPIRTPPCRITTLGGMGSGQGPYAMKTLGKFAGYMDSYYVLALGGSRTGGMGQCHDIWRKISGGRLAYYEAHSDKAGILINTNHGGSSGSPPADRPCLGTHQGEKVRMMHQYGKAQMLGDTDWQAWWQGRCLPHGQDAGL